MQLQQVPVTKGSVLDLMHAGRHSADLLSWD
jgi:hypothetical protein